jgi:hypothetical protein
MRLIGLDLQQELKNLRGENQSLRDKVASQFHRIKYLKVELEEVRQPSKDGGLAVRGNASPLSPYIVTDVTPG